MSETFYRSFTPDLEVRSSGEGRTLHGIAVPYDRAQRIDATLVEQFAHGAFRKTIANAHRVPLSREHLRQGGSLIGRLTELREDAAGLYFEARISATPLGDETLTLIQDEALREVSIGFRPRQDRRLADGTIERVTADLRELAVVLEGAYGKHAAVAGVRAAQDDDGEDVELVEDELARRRLAAAAQIYALLPVLPPAA